MYAVATRDKARQKVKLAEICSDLQTAEEDNTGRSRRKQVYVNYSIQCMQLIVCCIISVFAFHC